MASFGDDGLYLENASSTRCGTSRSRSWPTRYGNIVHLGERECSIQRRSQKLVEESPSHGGGRGDCASASARRRCAIAREAGYENAGTVEFLLDKDGDFYFIEANARLQVEHPVTELVTGLDLVREQLRIAAGEPLGYHAGRRHAARLRHRVPDHGGGRDAGLHAQPGHASTTSQRALRPRRARR